MIEVLIEAERAMSFNLIDRAETLYRQVVAADPRNAIAVVGLARVALERGDEPGALALARDALAIDPENDKARRLAERLEEVLRTRGVEVAPAAVPTRPANPSQAPVVDGAPQTPAEVEVQPPRKRSLLDRLRGRG
jgi:thioredoxin-like negative regulator of GroEL